MSEHASDPYIRLLQAQTEELRRADAESNRSMMLQLERVMADKFRLLREERGWSQKELAERVREYGFDFHQSTIAKLEAGARPLRVAEMFALSHVFKLPPGAVFFMAYSEEELEGLDGLTGLLAREEKTRADLRARMIEQVEMTVDMIADRQTRINDLVRSMRRLAATDPAASEVMAEIDERHPEKAERAPVSTQELLETGAEVIAALRRPTPGEWSGDGEHPTAP